MQVLTLAERFRSFARLEATARSPLYEVLSRLVAADDELLAIAAVAPRTQPAPNLFLSAIQYLLEAEHEAALRRYWPRFTTAPARDDGLAAAFRAFCLDHRTAIAQLLATRTVVTNEVGRCACLYPAFLAALREVAPASPRFIEIGASAGLNLLWPDFAYDYGAGRHIGPDTAPLTLHCAWRGAPPPDLRPAERAPALPIGIDLVPFDLEAEADRRWLNALVWPEHRARLRRLEAAIDYARRRRITVRIGDALALLPQVLAELAPGEPACLWHSFVLNQFTDAERVQLDELLTIASTARTLHRIALEWEGDGPTLRFIPYVSGARRGERRLARCDAHGAWIEWQHAG
jgi:hypothetical protein